MGKNEERLKGAREITSRISEAKGVKMTENERLQAEIRSIMKSVAPKTEKITAFVIGYNCNAPRKILKKPKKHEPTEDEIMLERIDKATI